VSCPATSSEVAYIGSRGTDLLIGEAGLQFGLQSTRRTEPGHRTPGPGAEASSRDHSNPSSPLRFQTVSRNRPLRP
jgi:hypothetical protein